MDKPAFEKRVIGLTVRELDTISFLTGFETRVVYNDGLSTYPGEDYRVNRLSVHLVNGRVSKIDTLDNDPWY